MRKVYVLMAAVAILMVGCKSNGSKKAAAEAAKAEEVAAQKAKVFEETIEAIEAEEEINVREAVEKLSAIDAEGAVESLAETLEKNPDYAIPFAAVENKPSFAGGDANDFSKWVGENIVYPQDAVDQKLEGKVILQFTVNKEGDVKDVTVLRGVNELLDAEAVRVVSSSPKWEVGSQNGIPVAVKYVFPVVFKIHE
ncbi:MAG: energy transducer TonB [Bacteroidales bacterium]|nr:energy transducer TonB [Bacteroidales bacterium]